MDRIDRHDVRVLEPGEGVRLARDVGRDLQGDEPIGEIPLPGEIDPAERSSAKFAVDPEAEELPAWRGEAGQGIGQPLGLVRMGPVDRAEELLFGHPRDREFERRAGRGRRGLSGLGAEPGLLESDLIDELAGVEQVGEEGAIMVDPARVAIVPGPFEVDADEFAGDRQAIGVAPLGGEGPDVGLGAVRDRLLEGFHGLGDGRLSSPIVGRAHVKGPRRSKLRGSDGIPGERVPPFAWSAWFRPRCRSPHAPRSEVR